ncbi:MAG: preprotein translocase subunit SecG [Pseudobdellovibrionaceae bacterium]|uniref:preprotein translocase subunit SecG n=1 Tax=Oligoflexus sp. TaxID=1971216 RepID=UPI0027C527DC|nr:preprotein translocase subunit SecG [Oligoflexus sp.]MDQ3234060.1 preprotein translocase subunit SecG [Pseudobdellovibrionaceae bacterium]HYX34777.1 preprotein translocase subunit SecG [Oligoflexus sp.]
MDILLTVVHIAAAIFMIVVIIVQGGNSGGVGAAFGGGNSTGLFGAAGATSFLGKLTYIMAGVFMITSIALTMVKGSSGKTGLTERLEQAGTKTEQPAPAAQPQPEAAPVAPPVEGQAPQAEPNKP